MQRENLTLGIKGREILGLRPLHHLLQKSLQQKNLPQTAQHQQQRHLQIDAGAKELDGNIDHLHGRGLQAVGECKNLMVSLRGHAHYKNPMITIS